MKLWKFFLLVPFAYITMLTQLSAHQGATGIVKERMTLMKELGDDMKYMKRMSNGKTSYDASKFKNHVQSMKTNSQKMVDLFPEGSLQHPTEARPIIWDRWSEFERLDDLLTDEVEKLERSLSSNDLAIIGTRLKKVGKTCFGCHKKFRKKKK